MLHKCRAFGANDIGLVDTEERGFRDNSALTALRDCCHTHKLTPEAKAYEEGALYGGQNLSGKHFERSADGK